MKIKNRLINSYLKLSVNWFIYSILSFILCCFIENKLTITIFASCVSGLIIFLYLFIQTKDNKNYNNKTLF